MNKDEEKITLKNVKKKETGIDRENNLYIKEFLSYLALKREIPAIPLQDMKET